MLDRFANPYLEKPLNWMAKGVIALGMRPDYVALIGFGLGMLALPALATEHYGLALVFIVLNRLADGLDGAVARATTASDAGGFLDITLDFIFYSSVPLGFILAHPLQNAAAGGVLMLSFVGTGVSFLASAIFAERHNITNIDYPNKSFHYAGGLMEGGETQLFFIIMCLFPLYFPWLALVFALLCALTSGLRIYAGFKTLSALSS
ncbi:CDP-alcohol phosphatidyltransferase family protein [Vreelandella nanhaiensis]|uniref:CDP-alcohol phosphatidyltransferase family protein n=1 Tax=Vreelandella nanhaiensis TaxID=1258546 RepID=A0A3S0WK13_9GAMM|nr:CDP-alcohol phosphatidyltransferase family protein [Halomonas nanhaiensis]RUR31152.1 CDP-alcohol phosphatidyltransferase family protein [Halomonas nanhaiensis]